MNSGEDNKDLGSASLRSHTWKRFIHGPDSELLENLYVPALSRSVRYDRCCAYFSSSVLAAAARGFAGLIERLLSLGEKAPRPAVRLVVNEELPEDDVRALTETGDLSALEELLKRRFRSPRELLEKQRLAMLAWLVKQQWLEVRVGVMRHGTGILHAKYGIATDENQDAVVFCGSGNESAQGLKSNYEQLEVSTSWDDAARHRYYSGQFETLWTDTHADVHTVTLPEAIRLRLIKYAPAEAPAIEPSTTQARQKAAMLLGYAVEAPYLPNGDSACDATTMVELWPHQKRVVEETTQAWPEGRMLCDEVGMGKTIEAILVLRRLMAGRGVKRALLLLPAGLLKQWQGELREKGAMILPRLESTNTLVWPDDRIQKVAGIAEALAEDLLIMSRETARSEGNWTLLMAASAWDLIILDEAHAARRRQQVEGEFNQGTLLLNLLRRMQLQQKARGILLLSATPMQTHPWEPWDLLAVLGEGGQWLADFSGVRQFYAAIASLQSGSCNMATAKEAASMIVSDSDFPSLPMELRPSTGGNTSSILDLSRALAFTRPTQRQAVISWLRQGSPLARRMHRNTRSTLREYYRRGWISNPPPDRIVEDRVFEYQNKAEREIYDSITRYIDARFLELEKEKAGKGFVMTIYRRRASSSPLALERSLGRRREGLQRAASRLAYDPILTDEEGLDSRDLGDLGDEDTAEKASAALPTDPQTARRELTDVERILADLQRLRGCDSKLEYFYAELRRITQDGRPILLFTEYTDTMEYLRDSLVPHYGSGLGCYSGEGGQLWDGQNWKPVTKDIITQALNAGRLNVLICTDAASEGLNLQAAGAVINYDLPWNPSKVEQRIGRVDRIGQEMPEVRVVNLFLKDSVDDRVYKLLRLRCGLFMRFVGSMQPVLARARRMLIGREKVDIKALESEADEISCEPLAEETYIESPAEQTEQAPAILSRSELEALLGVLSEDIGIRHETHEHSGRHIISPVGKSPWIVGSTMEALERDHKATPLSPLEPRLRELAASMMRAGERLPLVIGTHQSGGFRRSIACWVTTDQIIEIASFAALRTLVNEWNGQYADPSHWIKADELARYAARTQVQEMEQRAEERQRKGLARQIESARIRLQRELGRYLACLDQGTSDLNQLLYQQTLRDIASAIRLKRCLEKLGGYPEWDSDLCLELDAFAQKLSEGQRRARLLGTEVDAALDDPRWSALISLSEITYSAEG